jgi:alpha-tubulin suppressor-like RCC1 family protein
MSLNDSGEVYTWGGHLKR